MGYSGKTWMALGSVVIAAWMVIAALKWPLRTALFPVVVGIPVFFMAIAELLYCLSERQAIGLRKDTKGRESSGEEDQALPLGKTLFAFLLIICFFLLILFFGFQIGVPLFVFLYLKIYGRERWRTSLGLSVVAWASFFGLFVWLLNTRFPEGWMQRGLRFLGIG